MYTVDTMGLPEGGFTPEADGYIPEIEGTVDRSPWTRGPRHNRLGPNSPLPEISGSKLQGLPPFLGQLRQDLGHETTRSSFIKNLGTATMAGLGLYRLLTKLKWLEDLPKPSSHWEGPIVSRRKFLTSGAVAAGILAALANRPRNIAQGQPQPKLDHKIGLPFAGKGPYEISVPKSIAPTVTPIITSTAPIPTETPATPATATVTATATTKPTEVPPPTEVPDLHREKLRNYPFITQGFSIDAPTTRPFLHRAIPGGSPEVPESAREIVVRTTFKVTDSEEEIADTARYMTIPFFTGSRLKFTFEQGQTRLDRSVEIDPKTGKRNYSWTVTNIHRDWYYDDQGNLKWDADPPLIILQTDTDVPACDAILTYDRTTHMAQWVLKFASVNIPDPEDPTKTVAVDLTFPVPPFRMYATDPDFAPAAPVSTIIMFGTHATVESTMDVRHKTENEIHEYQEPETLRLLRDLGIELKAYGMAGSIWEEHFYWKQFIPYAMRRSYTRAQEFVHGFYLGRYADVDAEAYQVWTKMDEDNFGANEPENIWHSWQFPDLHALALQRSFVGRVLKKIQEYGQPIPVPETLSAGIFGDVPPYLYDDRSRLDKPRAKKHFNNLIDKVCDHILKPGFGDNLQSTLYVFNGAVGSAGWRQVMSDYIIQGLRRAREKGVQNVGFREDGLFGGSQSFASRRMDEITQTINQAHIAGIDDLSICLGGVVKATDIEGSIGQIRSVQVKNDIATRIRQITQTNTKIMGGDANITILPVSTIDLDFHIDWAGVKEEDKPAKLVEILQRLFALRQENNVRLTYTIRQMEDLELLAEDETQQLLINAINNPPNVAKVIPFPTKTAPLKRAA